MERRKAAGLAGILTFFVALFCADWLGYAVSFALFRLEPRAVPDAFHVVLPTPRAEGGTHYVPVRWQDAAELKSQRGVQTYRLPATEAKIPGPKVRFSLTVLEDDGARQLVQVDSSGLLRMRSRYEAWTDRVVPVAYRSFAWEYEGRRSVTASVLAFAASFAAAFAAGYGVRRLVATPRADVDKPTG